MSLTVEELQERYMGLVARDETHFYRLLNEAEARLLETAKWNWCKAEAELDVTDGIIYLDPSAYVALLGVVLDEGARVLRPRDLEFAPNAGYRAEAGEPGHGYLVDCGIVTITVDNEAVKRRKYKVAGHVEGTTVTCLLHKAHVTLVDIGDYTLCPSARAMKLAMLAVGYEDQDDPERANSYWTEAYKALSEQESTQRGGIRGTMSVQPFGDGIMPVAQII